VQAGACVYTFCRLTDLLTRQAKLQEISLSYEQQQHAEQAALILNRLKAPRETVPRSLQGMG